MEELVCNVSKCGAKLTTNAWATSCFHVFCNNCAVKEFNETSYCPVCKTKFTDKLDVKYVDTQPSEHTKLMMLVGLKPEIVMDVCQRALSFWSYQVAMQVNHMESYVNSCKEQKMQLEQLYKHLISSAETTINGLKQQNDNLKKELDMCRQKTSEFSEKLMEKSRYISKLQSMYEASRRQVMSQMQTDDKISMSIPQPRFWDHDEPTMMKKPSEETAHISFSSLSINCPNEVNLRKGAADSFVTRLF